MGSSRCMFCHRDKRSVATLQPHTELQQLSTSSVSVSSSASVMDSESEDDWSDESSDWADEEDEDEDGNGDGEEPLTSQRFRQLKHLLAQHIATLHSRRLERDHQANNLSLSTAMKDSLYHDLSVQFCTRPEPRTSIDSQQLDDYPTSSSSRSTRSQGPTPIPVKGRGCLGTSGCKCSRNHSRLTNSAHGPVALGLLNGQVAPHAQHRVALKLRRTVSF
jgi:hypothetical protein